MQLNKAEQKDLQAIESKYYMQPILEAIEADIHTKGILPQEIFNYLYYYLTDSKEKVEALIQARIQKGEIQDASQVRKSIAGGAFANLILWTFLKNKEKGNSNIFITSKISKIPKYKELFFIQVGEESQKPDVDLVVYSLDSKGNLQNCLILSLKTSLRERAGQTYK